MARIVLVCGIGCSGTSATAGVIHKLGVPMGVEEHFNKHPQGFGLYEDACFYGAFSQAFHFRRRWIEHQAMMSGVKIWGLKNTVMGLHLEWVIPIIEEFDDSVKVVAVHRGFTGSVAGRMNGKCPPKKHYSRESAVAWWLRAMRGLTGQLQKADVPQLHIGFEELINDTETTVDRMIEFIFKGYANPDKDTIQYALDHIEK